MKAAFWLGRNQVEVTEATSPSVDKGAVKIKVKWCGLCGSDIHEYLEGPIAIPVEESHPLSGQKAPVIMGHELSGEVVEIGADVTTLQISDRVVLEPLVFCGKCQACLEGKYNLCEHIGFHGLCGTGGGFAEYTTYPAHLVHKIPDSISYEKATLVEPIAVALHSLEKGGFTVGQTAVVLGAGPIGLATIESLKAAGARIIIVVQRKSMRQELAKKVGADVVLDPSEGDVISEIKRLTGGGADIAFEVTGSQQGFEIAMHGLNTSGTLVITSIWNDQVHFNPNDLVYGEIKIIGSISSCRNFPMAIQLIADGRIKADHYITKRIYLEDIVTEGIQTLIGSDKKKHAKIIVTPDKALL